MGCAERNLAGFIQTRNLARREKQVQSFKCSGKLFRRARAENRNQRCRGFTAFVQEPGNCYFDRRYTALLGHRQHCIEDGALARRLLGMYQSSKNGIDPSFVALAILIIDVDIARPFFANRYV